MLKTEEMYRIYNERPENERTNDDYFKSLAVCQAKYLNALATKHGLSISCGSKWEVQPSFLVTGRGSQYLVARVYQCINKEWRAYFDVDNPTHKEVSFVNSIFLAIEAMNEKL